MILSPLVGSLLIGILLIGFFLDQWMRDYL